MTTENRRETSDRNYPVLCPPAGGHDRRFSWDLVFTVAKELHERAFPELLPQDLTALLEALHGFVYGSQDKSHYGVSDFHDAVCTGPGVPDGFTCSHPSHQNPDDVPPIPRPWSEIVNDDSAWVQQKSRRATDPLRRFERLQDPQTDQPPACPDHDWSALDCPACGDLRRAHYIELGRRMAETADEAGPCAGGRCIDPEAHAEGAHDL